jgi:hypothetical protein
VTVVKVAVRWDHWCQRNSILFCDIYIHILPITILCGMAKLCPVSSLITELYSNAQVARKMGSQKEVGDALTDRIIESISASIA